MEVVWRWNIIRTAPCCVAYNSYAQWYAHRYEQLLNLSLARVRLVLLVFCKVLCCILRCFCVSLDHVGFLLSKLVVLGLVFSVPSQELGWEERLRNDLFVFSGM